MSEKRIDVLFVCPHNAGRSVVAKTLFNNRAARINPAVQRVLESFKIDTSQEMPKFLTDDLLANGPQIVTMGCEVDATSCPAVDFEEVDDWGLPDPSKMTDDVEIVPLVHEIARRVNTLIQQMKVVG